MKWCQFTNFQTLSETIEMLACGHLQNASKTWGKFRNQPQRWMFIVLVCLCGKFGTILYLSMVTFQYARSMSFKRTQDQWSRMRKLILRSQSWSDFVGKQILRVGLNLLKYANYSFKTFSQILEIILISLSIIINT